MSFVREILISPERILGGRISIMLVPITLVGESIISWHHDHSFLVLPMRRFIPILWALIIAQSELYCSNMSVKIITYNVQRNHSGEVVPVVQDLAQKHPDSLICLQEVTDVI